MHDTEQKPESTPISTKAENLEQNGVKHNLKTVCNNKSTPQNFLHQKIFHCIVAVLSLCHNMFSYLLFKNAALWIMFCVIEHENRRFQYGASIYHANRTNLKC